MILLTLLLAGPGRDAREPGRTRPPVEDSRNQPCSNVPHAGYRVQVGWGTGDTHAQARNDAYANGKALLMQGTQTYGDMRQAAFERHVRAWEEPEFTREGLKWSACQAVVIELAHIEGLERDGLALEKELDGLARLVAEAVGEGVVELLEPVWESGCASEPGRALNQALRVRLARVGTQVLPGDYHEDGAVRVQIRLTAALADTHAVVSTLDPPRVLGGAAFPNDLLGIGSGAVGSCASNATLGLKDSSSPGAEGLRVWLNLPSDNGRLCEGERMAPTVSVNQPAKVQVYSTTEDGTSYLIWPRAGTSPQVLPDTPLVLPQLEALYDHEGATERLVAVAVPLDADLGQADGWTGTCRVHRWRRSQFPEGAAVDSRGFVVGESGLHGCPTVERRPPGALDHLPECAGP